MKKISILAIIFAFSILIFATPALAKIWKVPRDFTEIQDAIDDDDVVAGDTILVGPGSFAGALVPK